MPFSGRWFYGDSVFIVVLALADAGRGLADGQAGSRALGRSKDQTPRASRDRGRDRHRLYRCDGRTCACSDRVIE